MMECVACQVDRGVKRLEADLAILFLMIRFDHLITIIMSFKNLLIKYGASVHFLSSSETVCMMLSGTLITPITPTISYQKQILRPAESKLYRHHIILQTSPKPYQSKSPHNYLFTTRHNVRYHLQRILLSLLHNLNHHWNHLSRFFITHLHINVVNSLQDELFVDSVSLSTYNYAFIKKLDPKSTLSLGP